MNVAEHTLKEVDVILWLVEPTTFIGAGERHIAEQLNKVTTPIILVINKIDTVKNQDDILTFIAAYKDVCSFAEIVPLSALKEKNTDLLTELIFKYLPYGPQFYDEDTVTDQPMRQIAAELIREKALRLLDDEIPHGIAVTIEKMKERPNGLIDIEASIVCERESHKGIIIGKGGSMLKRIGSEARREIENMLETRVNLQLWVKVRKEWRDSELYMKNYGYNEKEIDKGRIKNEGNRIHDRDGLRCQRRAGIMTAAWCSLPESGGRLRPSLTAPEGRGMRSWLPAGPSASAHLTCMREGTLIIFNPRRYSIISTAFPQIWKQPAMVPIFWK